MRVEQAVFGERRGGHALLEATGEGALAAEIASRLDLPDTAPSGVEWSPAFSGFPYSDHYILARTFLDGAAPRAGMVLSHALISPLHDLANRTDLRPLVSRLISQARQPEDLAGFDLDDQAQQPVPPADGLAGLAEALTTRGTGPVVCLGPAGFEDLVCALWFRLWPAIREKLAFRLSFGPGDLVEGPPPALVWTPAGLVTRWQGYRIMDPAPREPETLSAALLTGREEGLPLLAFAGSFGATVDTLTGLSLLEQAYLLAELEAPTLADATAAVRLIEKLSPAAGSGVAAKTRLLARLPPQIVSADASALLTLRNLGLDGYSDRQTVWDSVQSWAESGKFSAADDAAFLLLIDDAMVRSDALASWRSSVVRGLHAAARRTGNGFASGFWRWAELEPSLLAALAGSVGLDPPVERLLVEAAPAQVGGKAARAVRHLAEAGRLPQLHGVAIAALYPAVEAARAQIRMEGPHRSARGMALALRHAEPKELIACALLLADPQLTALAGDAAAGRPELLAETDMGTAPGQAVWTAALASNPASWSGPRDPASARGQVLTNLLEGRGASAGLLLALAGTPLADLSGFGRRAELWDRLADETLHLFMEATARGWIERTCAGDAPFMPDCRLEAVIVRAVTLDTNRLATLPFSVGLHLAAALPSFPERNFLAWLKSSFDRISALPPSEAEALGRLVLDRNWTQAVDELVRLIHRRGDLRPALRACASMLGLLRGWMLGLSSLTPAEKWESLEATVADLYPAGPDDEGLWARAGGKDADLPRTGTGRSRWRETLGRMRRGGGTVRAGALLSEIKREYPMNEHVRFLVKDPEFRERSK